MSIKGERLPPMRFVRDKDEEYLPAQVFRARGAPRVAPLAGAQSIMDKAIRSTMARDGSNYGAAAETLMKERPDMWKSYQTIRRLVQGAKGGKR